MKFPADGFQVVAVQILEAIEELIFRSTQAPARPQFAPYELKRAKYIRHLKEPVVSRMEIPDKNGLRGENRKRLTEQVLDLPLPVVVIYLEFVIAID